MPGTPSDFLKHEQQVTSMKNYDIFAFGHVTIGIVKTPTGEQIIPRGPILFASWTAHQLGCSVGVLTKTSMEDKFRLKEFPLAEEDLFWCELPRHRGSLFE